MTNWITKIRNKLADIVGPKVHVEWQTWNTIWSSLYQKENLQHSPWIEFQSGSNDQNVLFEKMSFGLGQKDKAVLGKVTITKLLGTNQQLQLHKQNQEICSVVDSEISPFWEKLIKQTFHNIQANILPQIHSSRLKIADDKQIAEELRILQWIKTSLQVLKSALAQVKTQPTQFISARVLMGKLPLQESTHIVIHCFNLEVVLLSTNTKAWKLLVYDHKDGLAGQATSPVMNAVVELQLSNLWAELETLIKLLFKI